MISLFDILLEDCWKGYKQDGMKKKGGKDVPNCIPESNEVEEALTPQQKLSRKRAMAGKQRMIQRKRQRTALRKKGHKQLYKKAYRAAYKDVYKFFRLKLFPDVPKSELSIIQKKQIEKWVAKKKRKVIKRARFKYLPIFREKEIAKFKKENIDMLDQSFLKGKPVKDESVNEDKVYIDFLNKKKGFKQDRIKFSSYKAAVKWAKSNFDKFSHDMIKYESVNEGRPIPMDTPNELVYLDFKKYAAANKKMFKKELLRHKGDGGKMFRTLSALWYVWAKWNDKREFTHIKDKKKFGRALMVMMVKDNVIFSKDAWKKSGKITQLQEKEAERDYKDEYKKFQSSTKSKKYRAELNKYNRDKGTYGNGDNKDASHKGGKIVGFESQSKNRGRAEKSRLKKK